MDHGQDVYADYLFAQPSVPMELPNIRSINYDRHIDTDAATCKLELYNTKPLPLGTAATPDDAGNYIFDQPGYYTFNRGTTAFTSRWHHTTNEWQSLIVPDRIIKTFEGYGFDATVGPEFDPNMIQSGVWMIDTVEYNANGIITINCRDAGRLLIDQMVFPPVVPKGRYPLHFISNHDVANVAAETGDTVWVTPTYDTDSSGSHEGPDQNIQGHHAHDAFDGNPSTYWVSVGYNTSDQPAAFEWIQGNLDHEDVKAVDVTTRGGPYVCYVSLYTTDNGTSTPGAPMWAGGANIPYKPETSSSPNAANIRYVHSFQVAANSRTVMLLGDTITDCTKVRLTFRHLYNSHFGTPEFPTQVYRAAAYSTRVSGNYALTPGTGTHVEGDYGDYSEIIKLLLAWGGFHWPNDASQAFLTLSDGTRAALMPPVDDPILGSGRVWGDIMDCGVAAIPGTNLDPTVWDKKSLMDGIAYIRDIIGFNFFIDESGAAIFRTPNVWQVGNFIAYDGVGTATYTPPPPLSSFDDDFNRPDNPLVGNGWMQTGGDFFINTGRAITRDASSWMGQDFGNLHMTIQADVRSPDDMQPAVYAWGSESGGGMDGYVLALASAAHGTNLEIRRYGVVVAGTHIGELDTPIGNDTRTLMLAVTVIGTTVMVTGYVNSFGYLSFSESVDTAPTGTWAGVGNLGLAGDNGISIDNVIMLEPASRSTVEGLSSDGSYMGGADHLVTIDENQTLESLAVTLSSRNIRDRIFIANTNGQVGASAAGHTGVSGPFDSRLRRVGGWTDQHFMTNNEAAIMADLISLRQLFSFRTDRLTIPGYSAIQIDDQVRIIEGTTSEDFIHYVNGISSSWDIESGVWIYTLDTHWLGENPFTDWAFDPATLSVDTQAFLQANGSL
jgi:hypothetical protein